MQSIVPQLLEAMHQYGIVPTEEIITDGQLHRFHIDGDNPAKRNGWAVVNLGTFPNAYFGSWKTGTKHRWQLKQPSTAAEKKSMLEMQAKLHKQYQEIQKQKQAKATETALLLLDQASPADTYHPYLQKKIIQPHGAKQLEGVLLVPMFYRQEIVSLQAIYADGSKRFLSGGQVKGCYFLIDYDHEEIGPKRAAKKLMICEGFATGATLKECYPDAAVMCAFTANNLVTVSSDMRDLAPAVEIIIAADNDTHTEGNPGLTKGRQAAAYISAKLIYPEFDGLTGTGTDFNDYLMAGGDL